MDNTYPGQCSRDEGEVNLTNIISSFAFQTDIGQMLTDIRTVAASRPVDERRYHAQMLPTDPNKK